MSHRGPFQEHCRRLGRSGDIGTKDGTAHQRDCPALNRWSACSSVVWSSIPKHIGWVEENNAIGIAKDLITGITRNATDIDSNLGFPSTSPIVGSLGHGPNGDNPQGQLRKCCGIADTSVKDNPTPSIGNSGIRNIVPHKSALTGTIRSDDQYFANSRGSDKCFFDKTVVIRTIAQIECHSDSTEFGSASVRAPIDLWDTTPISNMSVTYIRRCLKGNGNGDVGGDVVGAAIVVGARSRRPVVVVVVVVVVHQGHRLCRGDWLRYSSSCSRCSRSLFAVASGVVDGIHRSHHLLNLICWLACWMSSSC